MRRRVAIAGFLGLLVTVGAADALDYVSVSAPSAILYGAPSLKADKQYVVSRYTPLEVVVALNDWVKVRDQTGGLAWIEKKAVGNTRYVVVTAPLADVRQSPDSKAPLLFQVRRLVVLHWLEKTNVGWLKVRHQDGATGYVKVADVWGD